MSTKSMLWLLLLSFAIVPLTGCASLAPDRLGRDPSDSELRDLDEFRHARERAQTRPPVVIIPGAKGSVIKDFNRSGKILFGINQLYYEIDLIDDLEFDRGDLADYMDVAKPNGEADFIRRYTSLRRYDDGPLLDYLWRLPIIDHGYWLKTAVYKSLQDALQKVGGYTPNKDLFVFSYDWRLDNRVASVRLERALAFYEKSYLEQRRQPDILDPRFLAVDRDQLFLKTPRARAARCAV